MFNQEIIDPRRSTEHTVDRNTWRGSALLAVLSGWVCDCPAEHFAIAVTPPRFLLALRWDLHEPPSPLQNCGIKGVPKGGAFRLWGVLFLPGFSIFRKFLCLHQLGQNSFTLS